MKAVAGFCTFVLMTAILVPTGRCQIQPTPRPLSQDPPGLAGGRDANPQVPTSQQIVSNAGDLQISNCGVVLIEDIEVPARESGQLISIDVREGDQVTKDGLIARLDDRLARRQLEESTYKKEIADTKANDLTKFDGAKRLFDYAQDAFTRTEGLYYKGSASEKEYQESRTNLELKRLDLSSSEIERKIAGFELKAESVRLAAAGDSIERHGLVAPIGGHVFEIFKQQGEWVMAGDKVLRIARMDKLRVIGRVDSRTHNPGDVANRRVTVVAAMAGGKTVSLQGTIAFVALEKGGNKDEFDVWAEVDNQQENGFWLLLPRSTVNMTIHLNETATSASRGVFSGPVGNRPSTGSVSVK